MKHLTTLLLLLLLGAAMSATAQTSAPWDGTAATSFAGGSGTQADPYRISSGGELAYLAKFVNEGGATSGVYFLQTQHIDMHDQPFTAGIGSSVSTPFEGFFNGDGYEVTNYQATNTGLFGYTDGATIYNVKLVGSTTVNKSNVYPAIGGIVCVAKNTALMYCVNESFIFGSSAFSGSSVFYADSLSVGGIVGSSSGTKIIYCENREYVGYSYTITEIESSGSTGSNAEVSVGGVVGKASATDSIIGCSNLSSSSVTGSISVKNEYGAITVKSYAGGIVGYGEGAYLAFCHNNAYVDNRITVNSVSSNNMGASSSLCYAGGIAGYKSRYGSAVESSSNTGPVSGSCTSTVYAARANDLKCYVGGISGESRANGCYNTGNVSSVCTKNGGDGTPINDCYPVSYSDYYSYYLNTIVLTGKVVTLAGAIAASQSDLQAYGMISSLNNSTSGGAWARDELNQNFGYPVSRKKGVVFCYGGVNTFERRSGEYNAALTDMPEAGEKATYTFDAWCKDRDLASGWNMETDLLQADITRLYAKYAPDKYTVTFNANGGTPVAPQEVGHGTLIVKPEDPVPAMSGYLFSAWCKDEALTEPWDFDKDRMPVNNITLYAKYLLGWDGTAASSFAGGSGTQAEPYLISNGKELAYLAKFVNDGGETTGKHYKLTQDIHLADRQWTPIGAYSNNFNSFMGYFDGAGHAVEGLSMVDTVINATSKYVRYGVFGTIQNATIQNLGVKSGKIIVKIRLSNVGSAHAGGIAGMANGSQIKNCYNHAAIQVSGERISFDNSYVGGIVGEVEGDFEISECYNAGQLSSLYYAGGIMGYAYVFENSVLIKRSYNKGNISGNLIYAGGISGAAVSSIEDCYNRGNIHVNNSGEGPVWIAGLNASSVERVYTTGTLSYDVATSTDNRTTINAIKYNNCYYLNSAYSSLSSGNKKGTAFTEAQTSDLLGWLNGTPSLFIWKADTKNENDGYPVFNYDEVSVSFQSNGGTEFAPRVCMMRTKLGEIDLPTPVREGCTFEGWYSDEALTTKLSLSQAVGDQDRTLYAKWQLTLTFNANGGTVAPATKVYPADVAFGGTFPTPVRSGFAFAGWASDSTLKTGASEGDIARRNDTLYARWKVNIKFNTQGGDALAPHAYISGLGYDFDPNEGLPTPTREGYVFGGWHNTPAYDVLRQDSDFVSLANPDTLYALWGHERVTVMFDPLNGGDLTVKEYYPNRPYNQTFTLNGAAYNSGFPADPTQSDAKFLGWYDEFDRRVYPSELAPNQTQLLHAKWNTKVTVYFQTNGGGELEPRQYYPGSEYNNGGVGNPGLPPNPTREDAVFVGWYATPDFGYYAVTNATYASADVTMLYARWSYKVAVNFVTNSDESTLPSQNLYFGYAYYSSQNSYYSLPTPTKAGYKFLGWYDSPDFTNTVSRTSLVEQSKTTLYARWSYQIPVSFVTNSEESTLSPQDLYFGYAYNSSQNSSYSLPTPSKTGHRFFGWYDSPDFSNKITNTSLVEQSTSTLYAQWSYQIPIAFETNGGDDIAPKSLYFGYSYQAYPNSTSLPTPNKTGSKFMGWYDSPNFANQVTNSSLVEQATPKLYARWSEQVVVSFEANGGSGVAASKSYYPDYQFQSSGTNTGLPTPNKSNAYFIGWYASPDFSGSIVTNSTFVTPALTTLYARWSEKVNVVFIDYELDTVRTRSYYHGMRYSATPNPGLLAPISPYTPTFLGWYANIVGLQNRVENSAIVPNRHATLFAKWGIEVTFECNGGEVLDKRIYTPGITYKQAPNEGLPTPLRSGYGFEGWYQDAALTQPVLDGSLVLDGVHTLYAKWKSPTIVTVTFNANGGSTPASKPYQADGLKYEQAPNEGLPATTRSGRFRFEGWHRDALLTQKVSDTSAVQGVNHTLYAKWYEIPLPKYKVTITAANGVILVKNGAATVASGATVDSGTVLTLQATPNAGYTFTKWWDGSVEVSREFKLQTTANISATFTAVSVTSVDLNKTVTTLLVGGTETLTPTVLPANALNKSVTWSSSNTSVATVSNAGLVTAKAAGTATITVTTADGGKTATCAVTVSATAVAVTGVMLNKTAVTLTAGDGEQLTATVAPSNATNQNVTWSSSNTSVATVSNAGLVTAVAAGKATITVTTTDGSKTATCTVTVNAVVVTPPPMPKYTVTITVATNGVIAVKNGAAAVTSGTKVDSGTVLTLQATPNAGYKFTKWWDNSTEANRSYTLRSSITISATFTAEATDPDPDEDPEEEPKPTAAAANELLPLKLYPTVTNGELKVENGEWVAGEAVEVYSLSSGALVAKVPTAGEITSINISQLPSGTYVVRVGKYAGKVVVKK